jgi:hypothetical protein
VIYRKRALKIIAANRAHTDPFICTRTSIHGDTFDRFRHVCASPEGSMHGRFRQKCSFMDFSFFEPPHVHVARDFRIWRNAGALIHFPRRRSSRRRNENPGSRLNVKLVHAGADRLSLSLNAHFIELIFARETYSVYFHVPYFRV